MTAYTKEYQTRPKGGATDARRTDRSRRSTHATKPRRPLKRRRGINPRSKKMQVYYRDVRIPAVKAAVGDGYRPCQIRSEVCTGYVQSLHEVVPRGRAGGLKAAVRLGPTIPSCNPCNGWASENPTEAHELGLLKHIWEAE